MAPRRWIISFRFVSKKAYFLFIHNTFAHQFYHKQTNIVHESWSYQWQPFSRWGNFLLQVNFESINQHKLVHQPYWAFIIKLLRYSNRFLEIWSLKISHFWLDCWVCQRFVSSIGNIEKAMWDFYCLGRSGWFGQSEIILQTDVNSTTKDPWQFSNWYSKNYPNQKKLSSLVFIEKGMLVLVND